MFTINTRLHQLWTRITSLIEEVKKQVRPLAGRLHRYWTPRRIMYAGGGVVLGFGILYGVTFYWPRTLAFSYSDKNCFANPTLLPKLTAKGNSRGFAVDQPESFSVGGYPVYSHRTCVTATSAPTANTTEVLSLKMAGNPLAQKTITVKNGQLPAANRQSARQFVSTKDPFKFTLSTPDHLFEYRLEVNSLATGCTPEGQSLECDVAALGLLQGTTYTFKLNRYFNGKPAGIAYQESLTTVEPIQVTAYSVTPGQTLYNAPTEMTLTFNKPVKMLDGVRLDNLTTGKPVPVETSFDGAVATLRFTDALPRSTSLQIVVDQAGSADGGYLTAPFVLAFQTSGGPKVKDISIGTYKVQPGANIVLTFDVALAPGQNVADYISVEANGKVAAGVTAQGSRVTISPASLGRCTAFTVVVKDGLKNEFGISGNGAWQFKSRTTCQTVFSIGTSVQGRSITAYRFGDGPNKIIFVGGTHGDERSSVQILNRWIDQLESNPTRIPGHQTIIIIPVVNPDGYAANRRTNANNVDLNRNFPANNWKSGVTMPDKSYLEHGGGTAPLSEPESKALANYVLSQSPRLVLTYHAAGGVVVPNGSGDSDPIAVQYGKKSTVGYMNNSQTGTFFEYDTTGAFEDWLHDKYAIPALLIELTSRTSNDYSGHQSALWYIVSL